MQGDLDDLRIIIKTLALMIVCPLFMHTSKRALSRSEMNSSHEGISHATDLLMFTSQPVAGVAHGWTLKAPPEPERALGPGGLGLSEPPPITAVPVVCVPFNIISATPKASKPSSLLRLI